MFRYRKGTVYRYLVYIVIFLGLLTSYPYVFTQFLSFPSLIVMAFFMFASLLFVSFYLKHSLKLLPNIFSKIVITQIVIWLAFIIIHRDTTYFTRIAYLVNAYLALFCLNNCSGGIPAFFNLYNKWITIMAICGTVTFFLVLLCNISPLFEFQNQDNRTAYFYGISSTNMVIGSVIRYSGYFDEPGSMAFWGIWALIINKLFIHNKIVEYLLIVALIFTFSMAYYVQLFCYIIFFELNSMRRSVFLIAFVCVALSGIYLTKDSSFDLYSLTFHRFESNDSGTLNGDNRTELAITAKRYFKNNPLFGIGAKKATESNDYMGDNPYTTLAYDGIIGTIIIYLPLFILWFMAERERNIRLSIIILALGYAQRPFSVYFISSFILYSYFVLSYYRIHSTKLLQA